jgi:hypothetical protein
MSAVNRRAYEREPSPCRCPVGQNKPSRAPDDVGCLNHDGVAEHLIADHNRRQHQSVGVPGARVAEPVDHQGRGRVGQWPVAHQRLVGIRQDYALGVGVALDLFPELVGLLDPPAHRVLAARATQLVEIHGQATLAALHPLDHRLVTWLPLEADRHGPGLEHVL